MALDSLLVFFVNEVPRGLVYIRLNARCEVTLGHLLIFFCGDCIVMLLFDRDGGSSRNVSASANESSCGVMSISGSLCSLAAVCCRY